MKRQIEREHSLSAVEFWDAVVGRDSDVVSTLCARSPDLLTLTVKKESRLLALHPRILSDLAKMFVGELTPLVFCILREDADMCRTLVDIGSPVNSPPGAISPLHACAYIGNRAICEILISAGADFRSFFRGRLALHEAVTRGHAEVVRTLLDALPESVNTRGTDLSEFTPLTVCVLSGRRALFEELLRERGADPEIADRLGKTTLHHALETRHSAMAIRILEHLRDRRPGTAPNRTFMRETHVHLAAKSGILLDEFRSIVGSEAGKVAEKLNDKTVDGRNVLFCAVEGGNAAVCEWVLDKGGAYSPDARGVTPMHVAACYSSPIMCELLFKRGFPALACRDGLGRTPLFTSVLKGCIETCRYLLDSCGCASEIDVGCVATGTTPLLKAVQLKDVEIAKILVDRGADANIRNKMGISPFHLAVSLDQIDIVRSMLITRSDLVRVLTRDGVFPLDLAKSEEMREILHLKLLKPTIVSC
jgi:ankyrin repeat protein